MTKRTTCNPIHTTDDHGTPIVLVPLASHPIPAQVDAEDFDRLIAQGVSLFWTLNWSGTGYPYVRCSNPRVAGHLTTVARLILNVGPGRVVKYRDGNRLNLRRSNLWVANGPAKGQSPSESAIRDQQARQDRSFRALLREAEMHWAD